MSLLSVPADIIATARAAADIAYRTTYKAVMDTAVTGGFLNGASDAVCKAIIDVAHNAAEAAYRITFDGIVDGHVYGTAAADAVPAIIAAVSF